MNKRQAIDLVKNTLTAQGIEIEVEGYGCCNAPFVTIVYSGEVILNEEPECYFSSLTEKSKKKLKENK